MRYGLLSTAAVAALTLSVAAGVAQTSAPGGAAGTGGGTSAGAPAAGGGTSGGGAAGGGAATTAQPQRPAGATTAQPGAQPGAAPTAGATGSQPGAASGTAGAPSTSGAAATGTVPTNLTAEQRTQITRSFSSVNVTPVPSVNFSLSVGTAIPETIVLHEVPAEVVTVVPAYRRYKYFVVGKRIVIVDNNRRIVTIIERSA